MNDNKIKKYEEVWMSYINGQKKQMVEQMADIDIADFLEWVSDERSVDRALAIIIFYFKIKGNEWTQ